MTKDQALDLLHAIHDYMIAGEDFALYVNGQRKNKGAVKAFDEACEALTRQFETSTGWRPIALEEHCHWDVVNPAEHPKGKNNGGRDME